MNKGWIKLHREIQDNWIYPKGRKFTEYEAWLDILLLVNHDTKKVKLGNDIVKCERGQSIRSISSWSKRWNWSRKKVNNFFDLLEKDDMIKYKSDSKSTYLTVCNYSTYQKGGTSKEHQKHNGSTSKEHQKHTNKNDKNVKNDKKNIPTLAEVKQYFIDNGYDPQVAEKAYNIYNASVEDHPQRKYWRDSRDNLIKNWKLKMQSVWFKEENKVSQNGNYQIPIV